jgi:hypothetical protein
VSSCEHRSSKHSGSNLKLSGGGEELIDGDSRRNSLRLQESQPKSLAIEVVSSQSRVAVSVDGTTVSRSQCSSWKLRMSDCWGTAERHFVMSRDYGVSQLCSWGPLFFWGETPYYWLWLNDVWRFETNTLSRNVGHQSTRGAAPHLKRMDTLSVTLFISLWHVVRSKVTSVVIYMFLRFLWISEQTEIISL